MLWRVEGGGPALVPGGALARAGLTMRDTVASASGPALCLFEARHRDLPGKVCEAAA